MQLKDLALLSVIIKNSIQTYNSDYVIFSDITSSNISKSPNNIFWEIFNILKISYVSSIFLYYRIPTI